MIFSGDHNTTAESVMQKLLQEVTSLTLTGNKRTLTGSLLPVGEVLAEIVQAYVIAVKNVRARVSVSCWNILFWII